MKRRYWKQTTVSTLANSPFNCITPDSPIGIGFLFAVIAILGALLITGKR